MQIVFMNLTKGMDLFDLGCNQKSYEDGVWRIKCKALIVGVTTDLLFSNS